VTAEQAAAFAQLRQVAAPLRLRVRPDREGFPVIPGRQGQVEWHDGVDLAVFTDRPRLHAKLWAIPGVRRHQTGDQEMRALVPVEPLGQVATVVRARHRRVVTPETIARIRDKAAARAPSWLQDHSAALVG
jgi:hypothetical protein